MKSPDAGRKIRLPKELGSESHTPFLPQEAHEHKYEREQSENNSIREVGETKEFSEEVVEYTNAKGELVCKVTIRFERHADKQKENHFYKKLTALLLEHPISGQAVDILSLPEIINPIKDQVGLYLTSETNSVNVFFPTERNLYTSIPRSSVQLGILLHEIAHAHQSYDPRFIHIQALAENINGDSIMTNLKEPSPELLNDIAAAIPEVKEYIEFENIQKYHVLRQEERQLPEEIQKKFPYGYIQNEKIPKIVRSAVNFFVNIVTRYDDKVANQRVDYRLECVDKFRREKGQATKDLPISLYNLTQLPSRILERNANAQALRWLRLIKQRFHIDLFQPTTHSTTQGPRVTSVEKYLHEFVVDKGHRASYQNMRLPHSQYPFGVMPQTRVQKPLE